MGDNIIIRDSGNGGQVQVLLNGVDVTKDCIHYTINRELALPPVVELTYRYYPEHLEYEASNAPV